MNFRPRTELVYCVPRLFGGHNYDLIVKRTWLISWHEKYRVTRVRSSEYPFIFIREPDEIEVRNKEHYDALVAILKEYETRRPPCPAYR